MPPSQPHILILASRQDGEAKRVARAVKDRGASVHQLDTSAFPDHLPITLTSEGLRIRGRIIPRPDAVYVRSLAWHPASSHLRETLETNPRRVIAQSDEKRGLLESLVLQLEREGAHIINTIAANAQHSQKPYQLHLLERAHVPVPPWISTNDPVALRRFVKKYGEVIYKPIAGGAHVQVLTATDLTEERLALLANAPVLFQQRVDGLSIRAYVVDKKIIGAVAIHSEALDYRGHETKIEITTLTTKEQRAVIRGAKACAMPFSGVDIIRTQNGFTLLECNPSPMFANIERMTQLPIADGLAELLCG